MHSDNSMEKNYLEREAMLNRLTEQKREQELRHRGRIYVLLFLYFAVVLLNSVSVLAAFWLKITHNIDIPYQALAGWGVASGGLGAGSLVFRVPMHTLFSN
jgi:hypothetical protein